MKKLFSISYGVLLATGFLLSPWAKASTDLGASLGNCLDGAQTTVAMNECLIKELKAADDELNKVYNKFKSSLRQTNDIKDPYLKDVEKETLQRLVAAERDWINFRDSQCRFEGAQWLGGTGETGVILDCLIRKTRQRIEDIKALDRSFNWDR